MAAEYLSVGMMPSTPESSAPGNGQRAYLKLSLLVKRAVLPYGLWLSKPFSCAP
jgi:hypothetical protein